MIGCTLLSVLVCLAEIDGDDVRYVAIGASPVATGVGEGLPKDDSSSLLGSLIEMGNADVRLGTSE